MKEKIKRLALSWQPHKECYFKTNDNKDCEGKIINAHTVQKSGGLKKIATNGHVRYFKPSFKRLLDNKGMLSCEIEGVGKASTFFGFCQKHDRELFSPIENYSFEDCPTHALLHGYRAACKELYAKHEQKRLHEKLDEILNDEGILTYSLQIERDNYKRGMDLAINEITTLKNTLENRISTRDTKGVNYLAIHTEEITEFMCCAAFIPEISFDGRRLQSLFTKKDISSYLSVNIFSSDGEGVILFQWIGENDEIVYFLDSLISSGISKIPSLITSAVFEFFENTFIAPSWWNTLSPKQKESIQKRVMTFGDHDRETLMINSIGSVSWNINSIVSNIKSLERQI
ncbi:hypothetical protein AB6C40_07960 [Vibrio splendidus]